MSYCATEKPIGPNNPHLGFLSKGLGRVLSMWHIYIYIYIYREGPLCLFIPFYSFYFIPFFHFFQSSKPFHSIILFSTIFFNFLNPYTIFLNLNHLYHLKIYKVKPFFKLFSKLFSNYLKWSKIIRMISPNTMLDIITLMKTTFQSWMFFVFLMTMWNVEDKILLVAFN